MHKECICREFSLQTRLGGEICSSEVIMHKGPLLEISIFGPFMSNPKAKLWSVERKFLEKT